MAQDRKDIEDYRYFKLFEDNSPTDQIKEVAADSVVIQTTKASIAKLIASVQSVSTSYRGVKFYERQYLFNGIHLPQLSHNRAYRLALNCEPHFATQDNILTLRIASERTSVGINLSTRNYLAGITASTIAQVTERWQIAADIDTRVGNDSHAKGVYTNAINMALTARGQLDSLSNISFIFLFSPTERGMRKASYAQTFSLTGNNLYNPSWGYRNGKAQSANVRKTILPTFVTAFNRTLSAKSSLSASLALTAGMSSRSGLDWFKARSPLPDNYQQLPDYMSDKELAAKLEGVWINNDSRFTQIYFDELIARNHLQDEAIYIISDRIERTTKAELCLAGSTNIDARTAITYGLRAQYHRLRNFKRATDLLGGKAFRDIDYFLFDDSSFSNKLHNNADNPDRLIGQRDIYSYNYATDNLSAELFTSISHLSEHFNIRAEAKIGSQTISRKGLFRKSLFADNSYGRSRWITFAPWSAAVAASYNINERHTLSSSISYHHTTLDPEDLFLQSQYNNRTIESPSSYSKLSSNLTYSYATPLFALQAALFAHYTAQATEVSHLYYDIASQYADVVSSELSTLSLGIEVEALYKLADHWRLSAAATAGRYRYAGSPRIRVYSDITNALLADDRLNNISYLRTGITPAVSALAQVEYFNRGWRATIGYQYHDVRYILPTLIRRTESVLRYTANSLSRQQLLSQERLKAAHSVDITISKTIYLSHFDNRLYKTTVAPRFLDRHPRARVTILLSVDNLLGKRDNLYRAYESSRLSKRYRWQSFTVTPHNSYLLYSYPRTYFLQLKFSF